MIRLESFDCLNPHKRSILRLLNEREFNLREITEAVGKARTTNWNALQVLDRAGLISPKKAYKRQWYTKSKKLHRDIVRWLLTEEGRHAIKYYKDFEVEKNE
jgi:predicted transcriptional regulator